MTEMVVDHSVREDWIMHLPLLLHALFLGEFTIIITIISYPHKTNLCNSRICSYFDEIQYISHT